MERNEVIKQVGQSFEPYILIRDILVNWWVILLGAVGAALLTVVIVSARYEPTYSATATFVVMEKDSTSGAVWSQAAEMAEIMQNVLQSNSMNKIICEELGTDSVNAKITAQTLGSSNLLSLRVTAATSREAMAVIRAVMDNYTRISYYALGDYMMEVLEEPAVPMYPDRPLNVKDEAKRAFVLCAVALTGLLGLVSLMRDTLKREQDIETKLDARSLGQIPYERKYKTIKEMLQRKKSALLISDPVIGVGFAESYKKLAARVDHQMKKKGQKALVVTSIAENEGKSTMAANLAIALARQSKRVVLMEGDLRRPSQFLIFGKQPEESQEIGEFLKGNTELKKIIMKSGIPNVHMILGRNCYSTSTEMVQSSEMEDLLEWCKKAADYVIIDSPPVGLIGDAEVLARNAGAVMLVTKQNGIPVGEINDVLDEFRAHGADVIGVVLNGVRTLSDMVDQGAYGKYGKYYGK